MTTVAALLGRPAFTSVTVVTGSVEAVVHTVEATRLEDLLGDDVPTPSADIIVLLDRLEATSWRFDMALRDLRAAGAKVVVLDRRATPASGTIRLAERLRLTVLATDDPWRVAVALRDQLLGGQVVVAERIRAVTAEIAHAGPDVDDVLRRVARILGREVLLSDRAARVIAPEGGVLDDAVTRWILEGDTRALARLTPYPAAEVVTIPVDSGLPQPPLLVVPVPGAARPELDQVAGVLPVAALAVGHRLALRRVADERMAWQRTSLLGDFLKSSPAIPDAILRRAVERGWPTDGWHIGVRIVGRGEVDAVAHRADVLGALTDEGVDCTVVEQTNGWAAWTTFGVEPDVATTASTVRRIRRAHARWDDSTPTSVGVGRVHRGAAGIAESLAEASDAARLAASRPQTAYFLHVDRLGLAQLLLAWTQTDTFVPAARELLSPLTEAGQGRLLETLVTYLDARSSATETASILGVHRNTVTERITRVERLLGVDLDDAETRLALHLACRSLPAR